MTAPAHLSIEGVGKVYDDVVVLADVTLAVAAASYVVLLGPSGSGKTTLLSAIGGFTVPSSGRIVIAGRDVTALGAAQRPTTTVFQDYALFPHMSVLRNVAYGLSVRGIARTPRRARAESALDMVGLAGYGHRGIHELSGGQRQRVALARALVVEPEILLLDEPLGALDLNLRRQMQDELLGLQRRTGRSFVHVTHDQEEAMALASLVVVMNKGRIEDMGTPARVYSRPATRFTARFMGESTQVEGQVRAASSVTMTVETILGTLIVAQPEARVFTAGTQLALVLRPENISAAGGSEMTLGEVRVTEVVFQGAHLRVLARHDRGQEFVLRLAPDTAVTPGQLLQLGCRRADLIPVEA
jgi:spermidine/putrescine transport system ATP-binding protein